MSDTLMTIIAIFLAAILLFIFPLMSISERKDDISQSVVQTATSEFVDSISISGKITPLAYENYVQKISATGDTYEVEMEVQHIDENPGKKVTSTASDLIGENIRYSTFTTEILDNMYSEDSYLIKKSDNIIVTVKNTNQTLAQQLRTVFYKITGKNTYQIAASSSSMVVNSGK